MESQSIGATESTQQAILADADAIVLLRRIVKLMESQQVVDSGGRQRIAVDAFTPVIAAVTTVAGLTAIDSLRGYELFAFNARLAYNTGIRAHLADI